MQRDIALLRDEGLVRIEEGAVVPNLELMERFMALQRIQEMQTRGWVDTPTPEQREGRKRIRVASPRTTSRRGVSC